MPPDIQPLADSVSGACKRLAIGRTHLYSEIACGRLQAFKTGKRTLISRASQDAWFAALRPIG